MMEAFPFDGSRMSIYKLHSENWKDAMGDHTNMEVGVARKLSISMFFKELKEAKRKEKERGEREENGEFQLVFVNEPSISFANNDQEFKLQCQAVGLDAVFSFDDQQV